LGTVDNKYQLKTLGNDRQPLQLHQALWYQNLNLETCAGLRRHYHHPAGRDLIRQWLCQVDKDEKKESIMCGKVLTRLSDITPRYVITFQIATATDQRDFDEIYKIWEEELEVQLNHVLFIHQNAANQYCLYARDEQYHLVTASINSRSELQNILQVLQQDRLSSYNKRRILDKAQWSVGFSDPPRLDQQDIQAIIALEDVVSFRQACMT